jgi:hypothetical protein
MRLRDAFLLLISFASAACSDADPDSSGDGGGGSGGSGGGSQTEKWWCNCVDGPSIVVDSPDQAECASECETLGGMLSIEPVVTAVGTPACDAFCAKADALGCPGDSCKTMQNFWCAASPGGCIEALEAELQCKTESGTFTCDADSWQLSAPCGTFAELCAEQ